MSLFVPILKKNKHLDDLHFSICIVGSRKVSEQDKLDTLGWDCLAPQLNVYGFEADEQACLAANTEIENRQLKWTEKHFPAVISDHVGTSTLYVTKYPMCSSLYPPNQNYLQRFQHLSEMVSLRHTVEVETTTLDQVCQANDLPAIDFLQIDVQGAELQVLQGAQKVLQQGIYGIQIEVEFSPLYNNQPLFTDVDTYLRGKGFTLFDLAKSPMTRAIAPISSPTRRGQLLWGAAFYLKDLIGDLDQDHSRQPDAILKLACIADLLGFSDYCAELLAYLTVNFSHRHPYNCADSIVLALAQIPNLLDENRAQLPIIQTITPYLSQSIEELVSSTR